jgi:hypothetical protein
MKRPGMNGVAAVLVVLAISGVLWRTAGSPVPWRSPADHPAAVQPPHMPPPETFAEIFAPCAHCHEIGAGAGVATAPPLTGIIGRKAGAYPHYPTAPP